jgi:hypothetical protein
MSFTARRIDALDVLRSLAILGTLGTNIWIFTDPRGPLGLLMGTPTPDGVAGTVETLLDRHLHHGHVGGREHVSQHRPGAVVETPAVHVPADPHRPDDVGDLVSQLG